MKKIFLILCTIIVSGSVTSCGGKNKSDKSDNSSQISDTTPSDAETKITDSLSLLDSLWGLYSKEEKFPTAGGDFTVINMDGPGKYSIDDTEAIDSALGFPASEIDKIDNAASLTHLMNANTFTCGVFHTKDTDDMAPLSDAIKDNILKRRWICGFPDKLIIININDYIISAFGEEELINTFKSKITDTYSDALLISENPVL